MIKHIAKITSFTLAGILLILITLLMMINAGYLNSFIAQKISHYSSSSINADLHIESITGNLFKNFQLNDIYITLEEDTLIFCDQIDIEYEINKIWKRTISIDKIFVSEVFTYASEGKDSLWNFSKIKSLNPKEDTTPNKLNWNIELQDFQISSIFLHIDQVEKRTYIPEFLESKIKLNGFYRNDSLKLVIDTVKLFSQNPDIDVLHIRGNFNYDKEKFSWNDVFVNIEKSDIKTQGNFNIKDDIIDYSSISTESFNINFLTRLFPDLKLYGAPAILLEVKGNEKQYDFDLNLTENNQKIKLTAFIKDLKQNPSYELWLEVDSLDGKHWTHNEQFKSTIIGSLSAKGQGFDLKNNTFNLSGNFKDITYSDYNLKGLVLQTTKQKDQISGNITAKTWMGNLNFKYGLTHIFDNPVYEIYGDYQNIDLQKLPGIDLFSTHLNGKIYLAGQGKTLKNTNSKFSIDSYNSQILEYPINDFKINANFNRGDYRFEGLYINTPYFLLDANGEGNLYQSNNIHFEFSPKDIYTLISAFEIPAYQATGTIKGNVSGALDSLKGNVDLNLTNINYDSLLVSKLDGNFQVDIKDSLYYGVLNMDVEDIKYSTFNADNINLSSTFSNNLIHTNFNVKVNDSLQVRYLGAIEGFDNPLIRINQLDIFYNQINWACNHDSVYILLTPEHVLINRFNLKSVNQQIKIHGYFSFDGNEDLSIEVEQFDLSQIPFQKFSPYPVSGIFNTSFSITGTSDNPVITNNLFISNLNINKYPVENLSAKINYRDSLLQYEGMINTTLHRNIKTLASIPLHFSISDETYLLKDNQEFKATVRFDSLDIRKIYSFYPMEDIEIKGLAFADLNIRNSISNPVLNGSFDILNGNFENKAFGAYYKHIELKSMIKNNGITINKFNVSTNKKGYLNLNGFVNLKSDLSFIPNDFQFNVKSGNFQALKSNRVELNFDTDLKAEGTFENPSFKGYMKINRSRINADYFGTYLTQKTDDPNPPLLIMAMEDTISAKDEKLHAQPGSQFSGTEFYKKLTGEAKLQIPGNTWIRGKDMNFELEGALQALKSNENLDLFGTLNVKKGFYKIYGKDFTFNKGVLTFTGGRDINPKIDFTVLYRFRDIDKELRKLSLNITGRLNQPELEFFSDDKNIEEKDAIAYIVFGKSINQLSESQLNEISGNDNLALNLAFGQLSNILKETLQRSSMLDVVEITGSDNLKNNSVMLGKYITNNLYLSYEQSFSLDKKSKFLDSEKLMLEYQLLRNIILKATNQNTNSGFDIIFKKSWK